MVESNEEVLWTISDKFDALKADVEEQEQSSHRVVETGSLCLRSRLALIVCRVLITDPT